MTPPDAPILIDTNIWIEHFKSQKKEVSALLEARRVVMHPFIGYGAGSRWSPGSRDDARIA